MFKIVKMRSAKERPTEHVVAGAGGVSLGQAVLLSSGKVVAATADNVPEFIIAQPGNADDIVLAYRIMEDDIFETTFSADGTTRKVGDQVTLHASDGMSVTATTTNGIFTITKKLGSGASGTKVQGMFRR